MIKLLLGIKRASESMVNALISIRALYLDEEGFIRANKPGIYPKKEEIPTQTANPSGDE